LKKRNWSDDKIAKNLGMEPDEVLRLCQISGLAELFQDSDFSASWDIDDFDDVEAIDLEGEELWSGSITLGKSGSAIPLASIAPSRPART
jgi:hypothetical protein